MDIDVLADAFLLHLRTERRMSLHTLSAYAVDLRRFADFAEKTGIALDRFARTDYLGFLASLRESGLSARSMARHVSSLRSFFRYLVRDGVLAVNPVSEARGPKIGRPLPKYLTVSEVLALLDAPDRRTPEGIRDRAMLALMYASGLRATEVVTLRMENILENKDDPDANFVRILGKRAK